MKAEVDLTTCEGLALVWPDQFPRPDEETTAQNRRMIKKFAGDFGVRDPESIEPTEALSWALAGNLHRVRFVRAMFNDFERIGVVKRNVWARLKLPKPTEQPLIVPTIAQIDALVTAARAGGNHRLASQIDFAATVGLRFAEQQAVLMPGADDADKGNAFLTPDGIRVPVGHTDARRLQIDWQKARSGVLKSPKTKRGVRRAMVPERARAAVAEALEHHSGRNLFLWPESRETHRKAWSALRREVRIWFKWHNLRHYCATWLLNNGASVDDVAVQLGIRPEEVRDTYGHPDAELALGRLEGLIT